MASPSNQHCANCIGTLSFPITDRVGVMVCVRCRAYSKRVFRSNCALRIKKCAPRISSGIYLFKHKLGLINK